MPRKTPGREYLTVELLSEDYEQIRALAAKSHTSMNAVAREFITQGLNGAVTENNIEFLSPIIRKQVESVMKPMMERVIALTAKTCIQAGTAAYLSADAIYKFVPVTQREEVPVCYEAAKKKALIYMKSNASLEE